MSGFPGEIAGASLKLLRRAHARRAGERFPGEIAGASLKRVLERLPVRPDPDSPAKSPGPH